MEEPTYRSLYQLNETHWWCQGMQRITVALIENLDDSHSEMPRILDVGCGSTNLVEVLHGRQQVIGLDLSLAALKTAQQRGGENFTAGSVEQLPYANGSFDGVTALDVLYHNGVDDTDRALSELYRVLRAGGWLLIRAPAYDWLRGPHDRMMGTQQRLTANALRKVIERAGFDVHRVTHANTLLFPFEALWRLARRATRDVGESNSRSDLFPLPRRINGLLSHILSLERGLLCKHDLPFGLSLFCLARKRENEHARTYIR